VCVNIINQTFVCVRTVILQVISASKYQFTCSLKNKDFECFPVVNF
jgi:hypothetical protein